ncbi:helix-turn-helix domain-containing protein [Salegentibacter sp. JZCK2]|uniref:helix-turn-helix domain-containing protein n=1 Tax=Salegentibacter tibetensis TaxID=2873600 RepID=UPI001CCE39B4|nr:helix-turn-helix domain-containing protein [Salegentibacter tibetensis]MBZ9728705.1 helix-turn-helix domain-containing protein [Salegentibacter tibetensis]
MIKHLAKKVGYTIPENLQSFVINIISSESDKEMDISIPIFATGFPLMLSITGEEPTYTVNDYRYKTNSRLMVAGQIYNARVVFTQKGKIGNLGITLHPTAPYYLFHKSGAFFNNKWIGFEDFTTDSCGNLMDRLALCTDSKQRVLHILEFLKKLEENRLPKIQWLDSSLSKIFEKNGIISQEDLINEAGVSLRHFRRVFKKVIGVPPKYFCKVIQLNTVFQLLINSPTEKMHLLALDCGYFDQAHFINDFYRLIGNTPGKFLNGKLAHLKEYMGRPGI